MYKKNDELYEKNLTAVPFSEKIKALTGIFGIRLGEEPEYFIVRSHGDNEIRKYSPLTMASIAIPFDSRLDYEHAQEQAFLALSSYLFRKNNMAEHIAMTASVLHEDSFLEDGDGFITMSFILPNKYYLEKAPQPLDIRIKLQQKNTHLVATRPFSGLREESKIQKYETELRTWLNQYGSYKPADSLQIAVYDGPVTIPFLRKSEIHIDLKMMN